MGDKATFAFVVVGGGLNTELWEIAFSLDEGGGGIKSPLFSSPDFSLSINSSSSNFFL